MCMTSIAYECDISFEAPLTYNRYHCAEEECLNFLKINMLGKDFK